MEDRRVLQLTNERLGGDFTTALYRSLEEEDGEGIHNVTIMYAMNTLDSVVTSLQGIVQYLYDYSRDETRENNVLSNNHTESLIMELYKLIR